MNLTTEQKIKLSKAFTKLLTDMHIEENANPIDVSEDKKYVLEQTRQLVEITRNSYEALNAINPTSVEHQILSPFLNKLEEILGIKKDGIQFIKPSENEELRDMLRHQSNG